MNAAQYWYSLSDVDRCKLITESLPEYTEEFQAKLVDTTSGCWPFATLPNQVKVAIYDRMMAEYRKAQ